MPKIGTRYVPDEGPMNADIVIVGEAPGSTEEYEQRPFVGDGGNMLLTVLGRNGIQREDVRLTNLCHYRPFPNNNFAHLYGSEELTNGVEGLQAYLKDSTPKVVIALGNQPLYYLTGKYGVKQGSGIGNWRGSVLPCILEGCKHVKVVPTFHPAFLLRDRKKYPIFDLDIRFALEEATREGLPIRNDTVIIDPKYSALTEATDRLLAAPCLTADIETYGTHIACISFSTSSSDAVVYGSLQEAGTRNAIRAVLTSGIPLTFHFGSFDVPVLEYNAFKVSNWEDDTMAMLHVLQPELPRSLAYATSVYTLPRRPYYKEERKVEGDGDEKVWKKKVSKEQLMAYCAKDTMATHEVKEKALIELAEGPKSFMIRYRNNIRQMRGPALHMMNTGILVDQERKALIGKIIEYTWAEMQIDLNTLVGFKLNVASTTKVPTVLYDLLKLPVKTKVNEKGETVRVADDGALVSHLNFIQGKMQKLVRPKSIAEWKHKLVIVKLIRLIRGLRKRRSSYIKPEVSADGRWRSTWKVPATETARWACQKYFDGTGLNAQTFPRDPVTVSETIAGIIEKELALVEESKNGE